ncbi:putative E3 ubiquitin-protein ligase MARCH11, partial [Apostichopus japonicus]
HRKEENMETTSQEERDFWSTKLAKKRFIKYLTSLLQIKSSTDKQNAESNATSATSVTLQEVREFPLNNRQTAVETVVKSIEDPACRICQETRNRKGKNRLVAPCGCKGSTKYVHRKCLQKWCAMKKTAECEICHHPYHPQFLKSPGLSVTYHFFFLYGLTNHQIEHTSITLTIIILPLLLSR